MAGADRKLSKTVMRRRNEIIYCPIAVYSKRFKSGKDNKKRER